MPTITTPAATATTATTGTTATLTATTTTAPTPGPSTNDCYNYLNSLGVKLCDTYTKVQLSPTNANNIALPAFNGVGDKGAYCMDQFLPRGYSNCDDVGKVSTSLHSVASAAKNAAAKATTALANTASSFVDNSGSNTNVIRTVDGFAGRNGEYQAINGQVDNVVIKTPTGVHSIGTTFNANGKVIDGCGVIVHNLNLAEGDKIDFSKDSAFKTTVFEDLTQSLITMNGTPAMAVHVADQLPEYVVCALGQTAPLAASDFTFYTDDHSSLSQNIAATIDPSI
jgi:uncharacterized protein (UPF0333 family)